MKKALAMLLTLVLLLAAFGTTGLAEMELDVEENELSDFGDNEEFDFGTDAGPEAGEEEADDGINYDDMDEDELSAMEGDGRSFEYDFGGEGYTGTWVEISNQNMQFCLPEGWTPYTAEKALYAARNAKETVTMKIVQKGKNVSDIVQWAEKKLKPSTVSEIKSVGFYSALVTHGKNHNLSIYIATDSGKALQFAFTRKKESDLDENFALNIVSSLYEDWFDDEDLMEEMEAEAENAE